MQKFIVLIMFVLTFNAQAILTENISVTSNYVWRGVTQSNNSSAIQGGIDYDTTFGLSIGSWISNTDSVTKAEQDIYAGYEYSLNDKISFGVGYIFYNYLANCAADTSEFNFQLGIYGVNANVNYTDNYFGTKTSSFYYNVNYKHPIMTEHNLSIIGAIGFTTFDDEIKSGYKDFMDYKIGVERGIESFALGFYYTDTDRKNSESIEQKDKAFFASLTKTF